MTVPIMRPPRSHHRGWSAVWVLVVLLLAGAGYYGYDAVRLQTTPEDGRRLEQIESDPLAAWRPPGGEQVRRTTSRAGRRAFAAATADTSVLTVWSLPDDAELTETTAMFLQAAEDAGWRFTADDVLCDTGRIRIWGAKNVDRWRADVFMYAEATGSGAPELTVILSAPSAESSGRYDDTPAASDLAGSCLAVQEV